MPRIAANMAMAKLNANRFHWLMFILWQIALFFCAQQILPIFYNYHPDRICEDTHGPGVWNVSSYVCMPVRSEQCRRLVNCQNISVINANFHGIVEYFDLYCGNAAYSATLVSTLQFVGVLVGTITYGHLGDYFGRKPVSLFGITVGMICGVVSGFSVSWQMYLVMRFFLGTSIACILIVFWTYTMELIRPEQRVFLRSFFNWGYARLLVTLVCFLLPYWRMASIVTALLVSPVIPIVAFVLPESPKWYASKHRPKDVASALQRIDRIAGTKRSVEVAAEFQEASSKNENLHVYTIKDLLANRQLAYRTVVMCVLWFSTSLSAFGSDLNSGNLGGDFWLNQFVMSLVIAFSKIAIYVLDSFVPKFSRRLLHQIPQALMVVCYAAIMFIMIFAQPAECEEKSTPLDWAVMIINIVGVSLIEITWDACYLCAVESFPTEVRAIGMGTCSLLARVGALVAPQMAYMSAYFNAAPYILVVAIGLISLVVSIAFLNDTKGVELTHITDMQSSNDNHPDGGAKQCDQCPGQTEENARSGDATSLNVHEESEDGIGPDDGTLSQSEPHEKPHHKKSEEETTSAQDRNDSDRKESNGWDHGEVQNDHDEGRSGGLVDQKDIQADGVIDVTEEVSQDVADHENFDSNDVTDNDAGCYDTGDN